MQILVRFTLDLDLQKKSPCFLFLLIYKMFKHNTIYECDTIEVLNVAINHETICCIYILVLKIASIKENPDFLLVQTKQEKTAFNCI